MLRIAFIGASLIWATALHAQVQQPGLGDRILPNQPQSDAPGDTLSEQLNRSDGVIKPPHGIDPQIETPAPEPNPQTTPVIPPPDSPGGPNQQR